MTVKVTREAHGINMANTRFLCSNNDGSVIKNYILLKLSENLCAFQK